MIIAPIHRNRLVFAALLTVTAAACGPATPNPDDQDQSSSSGNGDGEGGGAGIDPALAADPITPADHDIEVPPAP
ncbi:MAG: hypothetical protein JRI68_02950 [Deltaproteobacteria bacterium]|nr:hypothetical protein [Deltaproteobacteria bacterium]